jgi:hypothetical protein
MYKLYSHHYYNSWHLKRFLCLYLCVYVYIKQSWEEDGQGSVVSIATGYGLDGPGIESPWGEIFRTCPDRLWGPSSLLYMGTGSFLGVKSGRGVTQTPHPLLVPWSLKGRAVMTKQVREKIPIRSTVFPQQPTSVGIPWHRRHLPQTLLVVSNNFFNGSNTESGFPLLVWHCTVQGVSLANWLSASQGPCSMNLANKSSLFCVNTRYYFFPSLNYFLYIKYN